MPGLGTRSRPWGLSRIKTATFAVGADAPSTKVVTCTLRRNKRQRSGQCAVRCWLTQNTSTLAAAGAAPSGAVAISSKGVIVNSPTAKLVHNVVTNSSGEFDLSITEAGVATWYLCVEMPDGSVARSSAITFA